MGLEPGSDALAFNFSGEWIVTTGALTERTVGTAVVAIADARARHTGVVSVVARGRNVFGKSTLTVSGTIVRTNGTATIVTGKTIGTLAFTRFLVTSTTAGTRGVSMHVAGVGAIDKSGSRRTRFERAISTLKHGVTRTTVVRTASAMPTATVCTGSVSAGKGRAREDGNQKSFINSHDWYQTVFKLNSLVKQSNSKKQKIGRAHV